MAETSSRKSRRRIKQRLVYVAGCFLVGSKPESHLARFYSSTLFLAELLHSFSTAPSVSHRRNPTASKFSHRLVLPFFRPPNGPAGERQGAELYHGVVVGAAVCVWMEGAGARR